MQNNILRTMLVRLVDKGWLQHAYAGLFRRFTMIRILDFAWLLYPGPREKRRFVFFRFCSDESYNGAKDIDPNSFATSGFFSNQETWEEVENRWNEINQKYGVPRFHAQHLNRRDNEYDGWCKCKADSYSAELLDAINDQGTRMRAYNCGMHADIYEEIISPEGREKLGPPWMACFKSCIAMIALDMQPLTGFNQVSVMFERGSGFDIQAVATFESMKDNPLFEHRRQLLMCAPVSADELIGVQAADMMAFEYCKRLRDRDGKRKPRPPYERIRECNSIVERYFGRRTLTAMKEQIENAVCGPGQLVIIPDLK
jgi:hypothetical protein